MPVIYILVIFRASKKVVTVGVLGHSWDQKMAQRQQAKMEKALLTEIRQERESRERARAEQRALTKKRREEYAKTRMLNTHQVVTNSKKLKRMSKKQFKKLIQK